MNRLGNIFFTLLRSAIWDKAAKLPYVPTEKEWNDIYTISKEQTVTGILLDAISKLPATHKPPRKLILEWIAVQKFIEKSNISMNKELKHLYNELSKVGVCTYLLKGQGVAQLYPIPQHRVCGDIDLYFDTDDFEKAIKFFTSQGCEIEDTPGSSHAETDYHGIKIELHRKSATFYNDKLQKRYNEISLDVIGNTRETVLIEESEINVFPPALNALQLLSHMLRHILFSGLGMRQICDWVLFIYKHQKDIDREEFISCMKELQLLATYKAITAMAIDYLGLPEECAICDIDKNDRKMAKKILSLIMEYGNFGHYGEHTSTRTKLEYLKAYVWKVKNCFRFRKLSVEAWSYPIWQLHSVFKIMCK